MKAIFLFATALVLFTFCSCKCETKSSGVVLDALTYAPLDSVEVQSFTIPNNYMRSVMTTSSDGVFEATTTKLSGKCETLKVIFSRNGYKDSTILYDPEEDHSNQVIYLELE